MQFATLFKLSHMESKLSTGVDINTHQNKFGSQVIRPRNIIAYYSQDRVMSNFKGCVGYIFASLAFKSTREHLSN